MPSQHLQGTNLGHRITHRAKDADVHTNLLYIMSYSTACLGGQPGLGAPMGLPQVQKAQTGSVYRGCGSRGVDPGGAGSPAGGP